MQLAEIAVKCPKCGVKFNSRQLTVIFDSGRRTSELRHLPEDPNYKVEPYSVLTCPSCGKSDWVSTFAPLKESVFYYQQDQIPHLQFRTAAIEAEREGQDMFNVGLLYLYAAWCADDAYALPQAREYRLSAAQALRTSLTDSSCPLHERATVEYLIGELYRRAGAFDQCTQHFKEVIIRLPSDYAVMARKLMRLAERGETDPIPFVVDGV